MKRDPMEMTSSWIDRPDGLDWTGIGFGCIYEKKMEEKDGKIPRVSSSGVIFNGLEQHLGYLAQHLPFLCTFLTLPACLGEALVYLPRYLPIWTYYIWLEFLFFSLDVGTAEERQRKESACGHSVADVVC